MHGHICMHACIMRKATRTNERCLMVYILTHSSYVKQNKTKQKEGARILHAFFVVTIFGCLALPPLFFARHELKTNTTAGTLVLRSYEYFQKGIRLSANGKGPPTSPAAVFTNTAHTPLGSLCSSSARMATPGARVLLRLPKAGVAPRLRLAAAVRQSGWRSASSASGVTLVRLEGGQFSRRTACWRTRGTSDGVGRLLLPTQSARGLASAVVSDCAWLYLCEHRTMLCLLSRAVGCCAL